MKILTPDERRNNLMVAIAEKLKKQSGENVPTATQTKKGSVIDYAEDDTVIHLQSTDDDIEKLSEVLLSLLNQRKGY